jgi:hypothetical protein
VAPPGASNDRKTTEKLAPKGRRTVDGRPRALSRASNTAVRWRGENSTPPKRSPLTTSQFAQSAIDDSHATTDGRLAGPLADRSGQACCYFGSANHLNALLMKAGGFHLIGKRKLNSGPCRGLDLRHSLPRTAAFRGAGLPQCSVVLQALPRWSRRAQRPCVARESLRDRRDWRARSGPNPAR